MYIIEPRDVRENTPVRGSVDKDYINPVIKRVQDLQISYVLGSRLLEKCLAVLHDGDSDPNGDYQKLIDDYIAPYAWWQVAHQLLPDIAQEIGQNGVQTPDSNQGTAVFEGTMVLVRQNILSAADGYKKLLVDYLCNNTSKYPEYSQYEQGKQNRTDFGKPFHGVEFY